MYLVSARCFVGAWVGDRTYQIVEVPHALRAGRPEVAGDDAFHARIDCGFENGLLRGDRLSGDRAQEDVDALQVLGDLRGRVCGVVTGADLDAARAQGGHFRLRGGGRTRQGGYILGSASAGGGRTR